MAAVAAVVTGAAPGADALDALDGAKAQSAQLVNAARTALGLHPLVRRRELDAMAQAQAVRMAARGEIYHNPNLGGDADAAGLHWLRLGENVGVGPDVVSLNAAFLASPHHRANMLFAGYNAVGVGIAPGRGNRSGLIFVAHVFGQLVEARRTAPTASGRPAPAGNTATPPPAATASPTPRPSAVPNAVIGGVTDPSDSLPALV